MGRGLIVAWQFSLFHSSDAYKPNPASPRNVRPYRPDTFWVSTHSGAPPC
jgi:hypothetical protein